MQKPHRPDFSCQLAHQSTATTNSYSTLSATQAESLKTLASALFYLAKQAEMQKLSSINLFLREGIQKIDHLLCGQPEERLPRLVDESLYDSMRFLYQLNELPDSKRADFGDFFESLRKICQTKQKRNSNHSRKASVSDAVV